MNITPSYLNMTLLPFAADEMKRAEQMFSKGEDKLNATLEHVRNIYESTCGPLSFGIEFDELQPQMTKVINGLVDMFHADGTFVKQQYLMQA